MSTIGANWGRVGVTCSGLGSPVVMSRIGGAGWVSRASGLQSPMVSDHEHNWGKLGLGGCHALRGRSPIMSTIGANWGRVGVTCSGLGSPVFSDHEQNWGQLGSGGCHALRGLWSPIMSTIGAIGAGWVSLLHGLRS